MLLDQAVKKLLLCRYWSHEGRWNCLMQM